MPKSLHGLGILIAPKGRHDEPDGDEGADYPDGEGGDDDAVHQACQELAEVLGVPDDKYDDFSDALGAYVDAKLQKEKEAE